MHLKCEAVIEILQDDKIRDSLNPQAQMGGEQIEYHRFESDNGPDVVDEDELEEMMAMQEECRLEMMKFYIQSQNPALFEEIYHDVSYPDNAAAKQQKVICFNLCGQCFEDSNKQVFLDGTDFNSFQ